MRLLLAVVAVSLSGCAWFDLTRMEPGEDCLTCHHPGGKAKKHTFTLAGTIYGSATASAGDGVVADITVTDANNKVVALKSNVAGNFYTADPLAFPVAVAVTRGGKPSLMKAPSGGCNSCHAKSPRNGARGRVFAEP